MSNTTETIISVTNPNITKAEDEMNVYLVPITFMFAALIIFGNTLTLAALATTPILQTRSNVFVASLAGADLVVGLSLISFGLWLVPAVKNQYESNIYICVSQLANAFMSVVVSISSLLVVSMDRWLLITRPFLHQRLVTKPVIVTALIFPWVSGFLLGYTQFLILDPKDDPPVCEILSLYPDVYSSQVCPWAYYIVVVLTLCFYTHIIIIAHRQGKAIRGLNKVAHQLQGPEKNKKKIKSIGQSQHLKVAKMMMSVFGLFFICWTPRITMYAAHLYNPVASEVTIVLGLLNSGFNFLVYPFHSQDFKSAFKRILCSCCGDSFRFDKFRRQATKITIVSFKN